LPKGFTALPTAILRRALHDSNASMESPKKFGETEFAHQSRHLFAGSYAARAK
jgi:hypothetical protein